MRTYYTNSTPPRYNWTIVESGAKHRKPTNHKLHQRLVLLHHTLWQHLILNINEIF